MASRFQFSITQLFLFLFLLTSSCLSTLGQQIAGNSDERSRVEKIVKSLSDAGYHSMAITFQIAHSTLISDEEISSAGVTIFCPPDQSLKHYSQPPLPLLRHQIVPLKLNKNTMSNSSLVPIGSEIDTLLPRHPLVVTTLPHEETASINDVEIRDWEIYNEGNVVVHGVDDFFDLVYILETYDDDNEISGGGGANNANDSSTGRMFECDEGLVCAFVVLVAATVFWLFFRHRISPRHLRMLSHAYIRLESVPDLV